VDELFPGERNVNRDDLPVIRFDLISEALWAAFFLYWFIAARSVAKVARHESHISRANHLLRLALSFLLLYSTVFAKGELARRFVPDAMWVPILGIGVQVLSLGFAVWARLTLGKFWSGSVAVKEGHRLIRGGPYRYARHPIYTGILGGFVGAAIVIGENRGIAAVVIMILAFIRKIHMEEAMMEEQFGDGYAKYRREVKALVPFVF
jgi:protein-S-isoprenylcysteine O-methyltransferase Ste14